jgi:PIN domain nuclease of toxin-antitoxin system
VQLLLDTHAFLWWLGGQAMLENLALVSNEEAFDAYGATRLW